MVASIQARIDTMGVREHLSLNEQLRWEMSAQAHRDTVRVGDECLGSNKYGQGRGQTFRLAGTQSGWEMSIWAQRDTGGVGNKHSP